MRNHGGQILDRVERGESMTITRDGTPVAMLTPLATPRLSSAALVAAWTNVPVLDVDRLRADLAATMDLDL